jgi:hypothetical protein
MRRLTEAYSATSEEKRSFEEVYGENNKLFEDADDLIDPRFRKLFESVYVAGKKPQYQKLKESKADQWRSRGRESMERHLVEKEMSEYSDAEWDELTSEQQDKIRAASKKKKSGDNSNTGPGHNKIKESLRQRFLREKEEEEKKKDEPTHEFKKKMGSAELWVRKDGKREYTEDEIDENGNRYNESMVRSFLNSLREQDSHDIPSPSSDNIEGIPRGHNSSEISSGRGQDPETTQTPTGTVPTGTIFNK